MSHVIRILAGLVVATSLTIAQVATVLSEQKPPVNVPGIDKPVIVVTGEITGS